MNTIEENKPEENIVVSGCSRCPDYDEECIDVKDHLQCFMGVNSIGWNIGPAKGYCPFVQQSN